MSKNADFEGRFWRCSAQSNDLKIPSFNRSRREELKNHLRIALAIFLKELWAERKTQNPPFLLYPIKKSPFFLNHVFDPVLPNKKNF